jgi:hypothetical protein
LVLNCKPRYAVLNGPCPLMLRIIRLLALI